MDMTSARFVWCLPALVFALPGSVTVQAQDAAMPCPAPVAVPAELAAWNVPIALSAAADDGEAGKASLEIGQAARLSLHPMPKMHFQVSPAKGGDPASHGGIVRFDVVNPGMYRVGLGTAAWVDVVRDGAAVASTAHGHGPACTGIRKTVDFTLGAGTHTLQIAGNANAQTTVLVVKLP